jgi:hypothetical protein
MALLRQPKLVLRPGRAKFGALVFLTALAAVCGVGIAMNGHAAGWALVVGALGLAAICWRLLTSPRRDLRLNQSGFAFGTLLARHAFSWCDVESFGVVGFGQNRLVALTFAPGIAAGRLAALSRRVMGFDRLLTETFGLPADELARLLESWRAHYGKRRIHPAIVPPSKVAVCV